MIYKINILLAFLVIITNITNMAVANAVNIQYMIIIFLSLIYIFYAKNQLFKKGY
jgi:hypothetical protein